jgi:hypothetical protein
MIDYYGLLAVGLALFIGFLPLLWKKNRSGDFLISYVDMSKDEEEAWRKRRP